MPDKTTQRAVDQFEALLDLIEQDGASPAGQLPSADYIRSLRESTGDRQEIEAVREAHRNGNAPPDAGGGQ